MRRFAHIGAWATIERLAGREGAARIIAMKGGTPIWIPADVKAWPSQHWLIRCVGVDAATAITKQLGLCRIEVPTRSVETRHEAIVVRYAEGKTESEIALELRISGRTVRRHKPSARTLERLKAQIEAQRSAAANG